MGLADLENEVSLNRSYEINRTIISIWFPASLPRSSRKWVVTPNCITCATSGFPGSSPTLPATRLQLRISATDDVTSIDTTICILKCVHTSKTFYSKSLTFLAQKCFFMFFFANFFSDTGFSLTSFILFPTQHHVCLLACFKPCGGDSDPGN